MKVAHSLAFFRHESSHYEHPNCGEAQGRFFSNFWPTLVRAHHAVWPHFEMVVHHDDRVRETTVFKALERAHVAELLRLVPCGPAVTLCGSMLWRLRPIREDYDYVVCRDVDSMPMDRDLRMLEEFFRSGLSVHALLDSESHSGPLMGGMIAFKSSDVRDAILTSPHGDGDGLNRHGSDQEYLNSTVWPRFQDRTFIHQRRIDVVYPAGRVEPAAVQHTGLDIVVRHIGAGYDVGKAMKLLEGRCYGEIEAKIKDCGL